MEGQLINGSTSLYGSIDLVKKSTSLTLPVGKKYVDKPIELTLVAASGSAATPSTTITANPSISVNATGKITATASASKSITPSVSAGWVGSGTAGTVTVSGSGEQQLDKIQVGVDVTGTAKVTPVISRTAKPSGDTWTDAASGAATSTKPSSGTYVRVDAPAQVSTLTSSGKVSKAGYGTTTYYDTDTATKTEVGSNAAQTKYVPIKEGAYSASVSAHSISTTPVVTGAVSSSISDITTTTKPSGTDGTDYWTITPSGSVTTTGVSSAKSKAIVSSEGYIAAGNTETTANTVNITPSVANGTNQYLKKAVLATSSSNATATTTVAPGTVSISKNTTDVSGKTRLDITPITSSSSIDNYYVAVRATAAANNTGTTSEITGTTTASVSTAGYAPSTLTGTGSVSGTATAKTSSKNSSVTYIPIPTAAFSVSNNKVYCGTAGYVPAGSASDPVGTVGSGAITNNTTLPSGSSSSGTIDRGSYIKIGKGYYNADAYYQAKANSGTYTVDASGTKSVDGYKSISVPVTSISKGTTTVSGSTATRGTATWNSGWLNTGSIGAAVFANSATSGTTYVDISATSDAPVLISGDYLYINAGYTDALKISLAKLVPDGASADLGTDHILSGYSAYNNDGQLIAGTIQSLGATTYYPSSTKQTIDSGKYLSGNQTIAAVTTTGLSATNIKYNTTVKVGDSADDDRITSITGTFTRANTVSSGQTAAAAAQILSGYSAWVNAAEVKGSIATLTSSGMTASGRTVTVPAGYYTGSSAITKSIGIGTITSGTATIDTLSYTYNTTDDNFNISGSADISAPTIGTAGYVSSTEGTKNANANGAAVSASVAKIIGSISTSGTTTHKPSISKQAISISGVTDAAAGNATTTAPGSGVYVAVKSAKNTGTLTITPSITTAGYGTADYHGIAGTTATVGAAESSVTYVPITTATPAFSGGALNNKGATITATNATTSTSSNNSGVAILAKGSAGRAAVTYNGAVKGWVNASSGATASSAVAASTWNGTTYYINGVTLGNSKSFDITVPNGSSDPITFHFAVDANGNTTITEV